MKAIVTFILGCSMVFSTFSQDLSLTFSASRGAASIDSVTALNTRTDSSISIPGDATLVLRSPSGSNDVSLLPQKLEVFPNPFVGRATISIQLEQPQEIHILLFNQMGQNLTRFDLFCAAGCQEFLVQPGNPGIYYLVIKTSKVALNTKLLCVQSFVEDCKINYLKSAPNRKFGVSTQVYEDIQGGYFLTYIPGDEIKFTCYSGELETTIFDNPAVSMDYKIEFYPFIVIGNQTWMAENLAWLPRVNPPGDGSSTLPYYYVYGYLGNSVPEAKATSNYSTYGVFYNWEAAKTACPYGWHLPSDDDWKVLEVYLGMTNSEADSIEWRESGKIGGQLKEAGTIRWKAPNYGAVNSTGMTVRPSGVRSYNGTFVALSEYTAFWSSSERTYPNAWTRDFAYYDEGIGRFSWERRNGLPIRCIKTIELEKKPTVTTEIVFNIGENTAECGGNVIDIGESAVVSKGVCWSTKSMPTTQDPHTKDGQGSGAFSSHITELEGRTTYYLRAYATNSYGVSYGEQMRFTTLDPANVITDSRDRRVYHYVIIGRQAWTIENLAWLPSVYSPGDRSIESPRYYVYDYDGNKVDDAMATANFTQYGVLYNYQAAAHACPDGWHLPSDSEWIELEKVLGMNDTEAYATGNRISGAVGGILKAPGTHYWKSPNRGATNEKGFTAIPGGMLNDQTREFSGLQTNAYFWTYERRNSDHSYWRKLDYFHTYIGRDNILRSYGLSVRCVKD